MAETVKRRYVLTVELNAPADMPSTEVPDDLVALENFIRHELGGEVIEETLA